MNVVKLHDRLMVPTERKFKDGGQMVAPCAIARTGIQKYLAKELGDLFKDRDPNSVVKLMRKEEDVFCQDSIDSMFAAPITIGHPKDDVNTSNAKELVVGNLLGAPVRDEDMLTGTLVLNDKDAIELIESGVSGLSVGYTSTIVRVEDGSEEFDAYQTNIRANHIAIVKCPRAGADARIADEDATAETPDADPQAAPVTPETPVPTDGAPEAEKPAEAQETPAEAMPVADAQAPAIEPEAETVRVIDADAYDALQAAHDALAVKLADAEARILDAQTIDALVKERMEFVTQVAKISDCDIYGMSVIDAKRKVVSAELGKDMSGKSDAYVEARFEIMLEDADTMKDEDGIGELLKKQMEAKIKDSQNNQTPQLTARERMIKRNEGKV